ncbi:MAG: DUF4386 domain-containing protein [Acidobacteriota bacterium]
MNNLYKNTGRIVGSFLLFGLFLGMYNNLVLLGPISFSDEFLTKMGENYNSVISSVLLSLVTGTFSLIVAVLVYPPFKKYSQSLAILYVAFCIVKFAFGIVDNAAIFALLAVSSEFLKAGATDQTSYQLLGKVIENARELTHFTDILFALLAYILFFYLLLKTKLIPLFFIIFGFLASFTSATEMILNLYGIHHKWHFLMLMPLALCQLLYSIWLIIKGFSYVEKLD